MIYFLKRYLNKAYLWNTWTPVLALRLLLPQTNATLKLAPRLFFKQLGRSGRWIFSRMRGGFLPFRLVCSASPGGAQEVTCSSVTLRNVALPHSAYPSHRGFMKRLPSGLPGFSVHVRPVPKATLSLLPLSGNFPVLRLVFLLFSFFSFPVLFFLSLSFCLVFLF